jgi:hypothetical protein
VSSSLSSATKPVHHPAGLLLATTPPPVARRPLRFHKQLAGAGRGEGLPCFGFGPKGSAGWAGKAVAKWAWPIPTMFFFFFPELIQKFNSNLVYTSEICREFNKLDKILTPIS